MVSTPNLPAATTAASYVVNEDVGAGVMRSARQTAANLAAQVGGAGAVKVRIDRLDPLTVPPSVVATDADFTIASGAAITFVEHTGTLTAARAVTLQTTNAVSGDQIWVTRSGTGAFNLNVGTGPLKALATLQWALFVYRTSVWRLVAFGSL